MLACQPSLKKDGDREKFLCDRMRQRLSLGPKIFFKKQEDLKAFQHFWKLGRTQTTSMDLRSKTLWQMGTVFWSRRRLETAAMLRSGNGWIEYRFLEGALHLLEDYILRILTPQKSWWFLERGAYALKFAPSIHGFQTQPATFIPFVIGA